MNRLKKILVGIFVLLFAFTFAQEKFIVVIDAGHGGQDSGAKHKSDVEKDIVLEIAQMIKQFNENDNLEIVFTRENDIFIELNKRVEKAAELNADLIISLHISEAKTDALQGMDVYISPKNQNYEKSKFYAEQLTKFFENEKDMRVKDANFIIIQRSKSPSMLFELGFLSNSDDLKRLKSDEGKQDIAKRILQYLNKIAQS